MGDEAASIIHWTEWKKGQENLLYILIFYSVSCVRSYDFWCGGSDADGLWHDFSIQVYIGLTSRPYIVSNFPRYYHKRCRRGVERKEQQEGFTLNEWKFNQHVLSKNLTLPWFPSLQATALLWMLLLFRPYLYAVRQWLALARIFTLMAFWPFRQKGLEITWGIPIPCYFYALKESIGPCDKPIKAVGLRVRMTFLIAEFHLLSFPHNIMAQR